MQLSVIIKLFWILVVFAIIFPHKIKVFLTYLVTKIVYVFDISPGTHLLWVEIFKS